MVLKEKTLDLLALLTTYARGTSLVVPMVPQPPTPTPTCASSGDATNKKKKIVQWGKGPEDVEEGEVTRFS